MVVRKAADKARPAAKPRAKKAAATTGRNPQIMTIQTKKGEKFQVSKSELLLSLEVDGKAKEIAYNAYTKFKRVAEEFSMNIKGEPSLFWVHDGKKEPVERAKAGSVKNTTETRLRARLQEEAIAKRLGE